MASPQNIVAGTPYQLSSTGGVAKSGNGILNRIFVSSASGTPTITVYDNTSGTGNPIVPTFTPTAGQSYQFDAIFQKGLNIVLGGTITGAAMYV